MYIYTNEVIRIDIFSTPDGGKTDSEMRRLKDIPIPIPVHVTVGIILVMYVPCFLLINCYE